MIGNADFTTFDPTDKEIEQVIAGYSSPDTIEAMQKTIDWFTLGMIEAAHKDVLNRPEGFTILDGATGVGDIPLEILIKHPKGNGIIFDGNADNVRLANERVNSKLLGNRITVQQANMMTYAPEEKFDLITNIFGAQTTNLPKFIEHYSKLLRQDGELGIIIPTKSFKGIERGSMMDYASALYEMYELNRLLSNGNPIRGITKTTEIVKRSLKDGSTEFYKSLGYQNNIWPIQKKAEEIQNNHPNLLKILNYFNNKGLEMALNGKALGISESNDPLIHNMSYIKVRKPVGFGEV